MALLSRIPAGNFCYRVLQMGLRTNPFDFPEYLRRSAEIVELIRCAGGDLRGAVCLEIGTGWYPVLPILLHLSGAERTVTVDVNPWLSDRSTRQTYIALRNNADRVSKELRLPLSQIEDFLSPPCHRKLNRQEIFARFHVQYLCPSDASATHLGSNSVDYVVSSNVLEHVPPHLLKAIHAESLRILKPGGFVVHRFNPQDHFAAVDPTITGSNFLRFSDREWYWYGGSGLAYHNRLRCVQHRELFQKCGFEAVHQRVRLDQRAVEAIGSGSLKVHADFQRFTPEELAADYMWFVGAKPADWVAAEARHQAPARVERLHER